MAKIFNRISQPSLRQGILFGLILGAIEIVVWVLGSFFGQASIQSILSIVSLTAFLLAGYLAGLRAAQATGKMKTGVIAGLWTGLIGNLLVALFLFVLELIFLPTQVALTKFYLKSHQSDFPSLKTSDITPSYVLTGFLINLLPQIAFYIVITLVGGILGSFLGRRRALASVPIEVGEVVEADEPREVGQPEKDEKTGDGSEIGDSAE
jgi:hypothetical protein